MRLLDDFVIRQAKEGKSVTRDDARPAAGCRLPDCVPSGTAAPAGDGQVGYVVLGDRRYGIWRADDLRASEADLVPCRFAIGGVELAVRGERDPDEAGAETLKLAERLTPRELQVAVLVAQGYATKNIAYRLQISEWTVGTYLRRVYAKLNVDSRAAMVYACAPLIQATLRLTG